MRIFIQTKAILIALVLLFLVLLPASLLAFPMKLGRRLKITGPAWSIFGRILLRYACHADLAICEDRRSERFRGTPCYGLYIANHQSYMDIPLILILFQAPPIMKKEILKIPIFGWIAWVSGALPVSRTHTQSRRQVFEKAKKRILKEQIGLQVYPEGTRSRNGVPKPFSEIKRALLVFAYGQNIPIVPVSIYGTSQILSNSGIINPGKKIGIFIHKEISPSDFQSADEFANTCWNTVIIGHGQMKDQLNPQNEN